MGAGFPEVTADLGLHSQPWGKVSSSVLGAGESGGPGLWAQGPEKEASSWLLRLPARALVWAGLESNFGNGLWFQAPWVTDVERAPFF